MSLYQQQKAAKPLVEDLVSQHFDSEMKTLALDFAAHMRENKMKLTWTLTNQWKAVCRGRCVCYVGLEYDKNVSWTITPYLEHIKEYEETIINEGLQNFVLDNMIYCCHADKHERPKNSPAIKHFGLNYPCNLWNCAPGADIVVCGVEIKNKCRNGNRRHYWFKDPDVTELKAVKRLLELEQQARINASKRK